MSKSPVEYDNFVPQAVPRYYDFLSTVADVIPVCARNVASLGTGTGNLERVLFERHPRLSVIGFDINSDYMEYARNKLSSFDFIGYSGDQGDIRRVQFPLSDCVVSSLTVHHITDADKEQLFSTVYRSLVEGGVFINYDIVKPDDERARQLFISYFRRYMNFMEEGPDPDDNPHLSRDKFHLDNLQRHKEEILAIITESANTSMTLDQQRASLQNLGFDFKVIREEYLFVVYVAQKAAGKRFAGVSHD